MRISYRVDRHSLVAVSVNLSLTLMRLFMIICLRHSVQLQIFSWLLNATHDSIRSDAMTRLVIGDISSRSDAAVLFDASVVWCYLDVFCSFLYTNISPPTINLKVIISYIVLLPVETLPASIWNPSWAKELKNHNSEQKGCKIPR